MKNIFIMALIVALSMFSLPASTADLGADSGYQLAQELDSGNGIASGAADAATPTYGDTGTPVRTPDIWPSGGSYVSNFGLHNGVLYTPQYTRQYYAMHR